MLTGRTGGKYLTPRWNRWLLRWPLVIAVAVLILGAYAATVLWRSPYLGVLRSIHDEVYRVEPASPGAAAGIQVGDRLTHVDGIPIHQVVTLFGAKRAGDILSFSLIRDGRSQTVDVLLTTPPFTVRVRRLSFLAIALTFWLVGVFALGRKPTQTVPRLFFSLCLVAATALAGLGLAEIQLDWANRLVNVCILFLAPLFIHFHTEFPRRKQVRVRGPLLFGLYLISLDLSMLYLFVGPQQLGHYAWFPLLRSGIRLYFVAAILAGLALLFHTYHTTDYGPVRRRVRLVLFGTFVALMPVMLLSLVPVALWGFPIVADEIAALSLVVIPLVYSYGILRHNLMGIDLVINLTVVYLTLTALLTLLYLAVVTGASLVLSAIPGLAEGSMAGGVLADHRLVGAIASLVVAASLLPLRSRVQAAVDRLFYRQSCDYQALAGELSERLSRSLYGDSLEDILVQQLSRHLGLKGAALLLVQACPEPGRRACPEPSRRACPELNGEYLVL
ncbi:MAG: PDZ domain-containing protein, partial [Chloroflexi bacterium]